MSIKHFYGKGKGYGPKKYPPSNIVTCEFGHVYDVSQVNASPQQRAAISWCPMVVDGKECGGKVLWINPVSLEKK